MTSRRWCDGGRRAFPRRVGPTAIAIACCQIPALMSSSPVAAAESTCPSSEAVGAAVRTLLGQSSPKADGRTDDRADGRTDRPWPAIDISDLGDRYTVGVKGSTRTYRDDARDCDARARAAAVFVALTLAPGSIEATQPDVARSSERRVASTPPPVPPPSPAGSTVTNPTNVEAGKSWGAQIEVGALGAVAPRTDSSQFVLGGELRFVATAEAWGLSLGGTLPTSSTFDPAAVRVRENRYPVDVGIRRFWTGKWLRAALDAGVVAALCQLRQVSMAVGESTTRVEVGVRAAATLATESPTFGLYLRAFSEFIPFPQRIAVEPQGIIGRTSAVWLGATVGVAARFH